MSTGADSTGTDSTGTRSAGIRSTGTDSTGTDGARAGAAAPVTAQDRARCPATAVLHRIGDRWSVVLICLLAERPRGYNELDRAVADLSRRVLTRALRTLEAEGYVRRTALPGPPYRVEYALTGLGESLHTAVAELGAWADTHHDG
ncbi:helix-turn-helix domain-containing protein [Kitasatospora sp. NPDC097605]|uniref:winged helix-turn-helix transcriptional regulator n=1 Tax=Kitasatospora sp. NPDC097605 TaxID=3157226 RepID=UPI00333389AA